MKIDQYIGCFFQFVSFKFVFFQSFHQQSKNFTSHSNSRKKRSMSTTNNSKPAEDAKTTTSAPKESPKKRKLPDGDDKDSNPQAAKKRKLNEDVANADNKNTENKKAVEKKSEVVEKKDNDLVLPDLPLTIIFLTGNQGKLKEVQNYVGDDIKKYIINYKVDLEEIQGTEQEILSHKLNGAKDVILKKLQNSKDNKLKDKDLYILVEDTSLFLTNYSKGFNFPGPFCKFLLKGNKCQGYIDMAKGIDDKSCTAMCLFGLLKINLIKEKDEDEDIDLIKGKDKDNKPLFFKGECKGTITDKVRGESGFGWDPIFEFIDNKKTFAEMTTEEKNKISHRANALKELKQYLEKDVISKIKK